METKHTPFKSQQIRNVKNHLKINQETFKNAFERLERSLDEELPMLSADVIPDIDFGELLSNNGKFDEEFSQKIRKHGVVIIRNVFDREYTEKLYKGLSEYMRTNGEDPTVFGTTFFEIYWSKEQVEARHHKNMVMVQKALLGLWKTSEIDGKSVDLTKPLTYNDRMRFRKPHDNTFALKPHLDSGSLERWSDPAYKIVYDKIFKGNWEDHDPFCVNGRGSAIMDDHCSFFRAFQGWTSLTESGPGDGTIRVLPRLKEPLSHILMRSLLDDIDEDQILGHQPGKLQKLDYDYQHKLWDSLVSLPKVHPGDTVWWHADLVHAVESKHEGKQTNSVLYIPVGPECPINRLYVERAKWCFKFGDSPPDFHTNAKANSERDFVGRATFKDLNEDAKRMMGWI